MYIVNVCTELDRRIEIRSFLSFFFWRYVYCFVVFDGEGSVEELYGRTIWGNYIGKLYGRIL